MSVLLSMLGNGPRPSLCVLRAAFTAEIQRCQDQLAREDLSDAARVAFERQCEAASRLLHGIVPAQGALELLA